MGRIIHDENDLREAQEFLRQRREDLGCSHCRPERWNPESNDRERWPCRSPMLGMIGTHPHGPEREVLFEQCTVYREWAVERKKRTTLRRGKSSSD